VGLRGHALALRLAGAELDGSAAQLPLGAGWSLSANAGGWGELEERHRRKLRDVGVVVAPAGEGLGHVDEHLYRPLRDASFLAVKLLDEQVRERIAKGTPLQDAFEDVSRLWLRYFGVLFLQGEEGRIRPDESPILEGSSVGVAMARYRSAPRRLDLLWAARQAAAGAPLGWDAERQRPGVSVSREQGQEALAGTVREAFGACDVDFLGPGGHEIIRVIFGVVWLLSDELSRTLRAASSGSGSSFGFGSRRDQFRLPPVSGARDGYPANQAAEFERAYGQVVGRFKTVAARLVAA